MRFLMSHSDGWSGKLCFQYMAGTEAHHYCNTVVPASLPAVDQ